MITSPPNTIEELLRKKRSDHIATMELMRDICRRIKKLEKQFAKLGSKE